MADTWGGSFGSAWGSSWGDASVASPTVQAREPYSPRYRRGPMVWLDEQGNEIELFFDPGGGQHIRMKPKVKKPYKPVRMIRIPRKDS